MSSFNVTSTQYAKDHTLFIALRQCWSKLSIDIWLYGSFIYFIGRMPFLAQTLDNIISLYYITCSGILSEKNSDWFIYSFIQQF